MRNAAASGRSSGAARYVRLAACALLGGLVSSGCEIQPTRTSERAAAAPAASVPQDSQAQGTGVDSLITSRTPTALPFAVLDSAEADLDGDGAMEAVQLAATVTMNDRGEPLWEDGHHWLVVVRDGAEQFPLLDRFVPWGSVRAWVLADDSTRAPAVLVELTSWRGEDGALQLERFEFDSAQRAFARTATIRGTGRGALLEAPAGGGQR